jgi:hypothetical protein
MADVFLYLKEARLPSPFGRGRQARARQGEASKNGEGLNCDPHPALRAALSQRERDLLLPYHLFEKTAGISIGACFDGRSTSV